MEFTTLKNILIDTIGCDEGKITPDASLMEDLEVDSLDIVELQMALEDACGVTIADDDLHELKTVGDILTYLNAHAA